MCSIDCIEKLLVDLRTLGKIEEGKKINTKEKYISFDDTTVIQPFIRWYRGDSGMLTGNKIQETLTCTTKIIKKAIDDIKNNDKEPKMIYLDVSPDKFLEDIKDILKKANKGIQNLRDTYIKNESLASKLELQIQIIDRQIDYINEHLNSESTQEIDQKE